jgi:hypothetical protein
MGRVDLKRYLITSSIYLVKPSDTSRLLNYSEVIFYI